ncbi:uncharacterized protein LOC109118342 [Fukomys damarensis]|uniref:uncharacterized protein LOC109118342 n=1 Tax=Fukomys damarensis TaxID=885580 RepID=UPI0008FEF431|nr:uncharacterized protein LOC109118342 [Fukomys damarensis]
MTYSRGPEAQEPEIKVNVQEPPPQEPPPASKAQVQRGLSREPPIQELPRGPVAGAGDKFIAFRSLQFLMCFFWHYKIMMRPPPGPCPTCKQITGGLPVPFAKKVRGHPLLKPNQQVQRRLYRAHQPGDRRLMVPRDVYSPPWPSLPTSPGELSVSEGNTTEPGDLSGHWTFQGEECCRYANKSGVVREITRQMRERLKTQRARHAPRKLLINGRREGIYQSDTHGTRHGGVPASAAEGRTPHLLLLPPDPDFFWELAGRNTKKKKKKKKKK